MTDRVTESTRSRVTIPRTQSTAAAQSQHVSQQTQMETDSDSLPIGESCPRVSRRLFSDPHSQLSLLPNGTALLADRFSKRLIPCLEEVSQGLADLQNTKARLTEIESRFGDDAYQDREAFVGSLSERDVRVRLLEELQNNQQLETKRDGLTKRCYDLERKLCNAETFAKKVHDVYYRKTNDEVRTLLDEVRARELELLAKVEKAVGEQRRLADQMEGVKEELRTTLKREEAVRKELDDMTTAYRAAVGQQQKAAAAAEAARGESARLEQQVRSLQQQLADATERERTSRSESARLADTARSARESAEKEVADMTMQANRQRMEMERKTNAEIDRHRAEMGAEYAQLQAKAKKLADELRKEKDTSERYADRVRRSEAKVLEWQERFDRCIEEERAELQKQIASSYRGIMSNIAPARRIMSGDEENASAYPLFSRRRDPSPALAPDSARPPSRGPPMAPMDDNRKRQLRDIISTTLPPPRR